MKLNNRRGLTLIEIVISLALAVAILIILFAALRLGYKAQDQGAEKSALMQKVRILNDRISWLIRGAYPFVVKKPETEQIYFDGRGGSVGFITTSVDKYGKGPEDSAGLKWVSIYADSSGLSIREKVFFLEDVFDDSGGRVTVLDPDVKGLEFEYYDLPEDETEGEWVSGWDPEDKKYLPSAVKVRITFEHQGKSVVMPEMIVHIHVRKK